LNRNPDFQTAINVRFNDIDAMGHVNNAVLFTYFEEGRKALFLERLKGVKGGGFNFILAHIQCDYLLPVRLSTGVELEVFMGCHCLSPGAFRRSTGVELEVFMGCQSSETGEHTALRHP
jgi:hypothetical protein